MFSLTSIFLEIQLFFISTIQCFIYIFSSADPMQFPYFLCSNFFWQVFLIHTSHSSHHRNKSAMPCIGISATLTEFLFGRERGRGGGLLNTFLSCQHVQNFTMSMEKHSFWWIINENLKEYFSLVNKQGRI